MTEEFREYVTKVLKNNGIDENVEFETSDENFGTLKWVDGTMYEDGGNRLACGDIAWILEESDFDKTLHFEKITFVEALKLMNDDVDVYVDTDKGSMFVELINLVTRQRETLESEYINLYFETTSGKILDSRKTITEMIDEQFYKLV